MYISLRVGIDRNHSIAESTIGRYLYCIGAPSPANKLTTIKRTIATLFLFLDLSISDHPATSYSSTRNISYLTYSGCGHCLYDRGRRYHAQSAGSKSLPNPPVSSVSTSRGWSEGEGDFLVDFWPFCLFQSSTGPGLPEPVPKRNLIL